VSFKILLAAVTENPELAGIPIQGKPSFHLSSNPEQLMMAESGKLTLSPGSIMEARWLLEY